MSTHSKRGNLLGVQGESGEMTEETRYNGRTREQGSPEPLFPLEDKLLRRGFVERTLALGDSK